MIENIVVKLRDMLCDIVGFASRMEMCPGYTILKPLPWKEKGMKVLAEELCKSLQGEKGIVEYSECGVRVNGEGYCIEVVVHDGFAEVTEVKGDETEILDIVASVVSGGQSEKGC